MTEVVCELPIACIACHHRAISNKRYQLCRACSMAIWRRVGRGEDFESALADRRRQVERAARGLTSGLNKVKAHVS